MSTWIQKAKMGPIYAKCTGTGWTLFNQCIKRRCPSPRDIDNGQLDIGGVDFGSSITYSCNSGYHLIGESKSYCELGSTGSMVWNPEAPICESVKCQSLHLYPTEDITDTRIFIPMEAL